MTIRSQEFKPLRLVYALRSPIYGTGHAIHLDSLMAFVAVHIAGYFNSSHPIGWEPDEPPPLPLAIERHNDLWWYRASAFLPEGPAHRQQWTKKFDRDHLDYLDLGKATKVTTAGGPWRERFVPIEAIAVNEVEFYAVGNYRKVSSMCRRIKHIGKRGTMGFGYVRSFEICALDEPLETFDRDWRNPDNTPARNLPHDWAESKGLITAGIKRAPILPPYWRIREEHVANVAI
jgi:CRISPR type IV-associated protein Csf3